MTKKKTALVVLSEQGLQTAGRIKKNLPMSEIHALAGRASGDISFDNVGEHLRALFTRGQPVVGLCAAGIIIRSLSPALEDKWSEPPVLCVSEDGSAVVPLLGGHHGANRLATGISNILETKAAITTSGDIHFNIALDEPPEGYLLANPDHAKAFMADVISGATIRLEGKATFLDESSLPFDDDGKLQITVTTADIKGSEHHLVYHPKVVVLGMGSERGTVFEEALSLAQKALQDASISPMSLAALASIDLKSDEAALHAVADYFSIPVWFYDRDQLQSMEGQLETPSDIVKAEVGVAGVCEGAALFATGDHGDLVFPKIKSARATAALARATSPTTLNKGTSQGRMFLIGTGPGNQSWRSCESINLLSESTDWVGYDLYLDLIQDLKCGQKEHRFPLGAEEKRVRHALELAAQGKTVSVVCSGDPGIYAMATLAYELIDTGAAEGPVSEAAKRVEIVVAPGISAFQAAAARAGAPIGHDFCCISLSDLLTPREDILKRLKAAAEGDFVMAFYNPRSKRRTTLLDEAFNILRQNRPSDTPVILATDLGRPAENVQFFTLDTVNSEDVDMLTLVMVGSSKSKIIKTGSGKKWAYTPRGYDRKQT